MCLYAQEQVTLCTHHANHNYVLGWAEPSIYTVYDRIFGDFPANNTVHTPYIYIYMIYGFGRPKLCHAMKEAPLLLQGPGM
jgi:hypothetical protein